MELCTFLRVSSVVCLTAVMSAFMGRPAFAQTDIVLHTSTVSPIDVHGNWARVTNSGVASGAYLSNPDRGRAKDPFRARVTAQLLRDAFTARRATAYHLWIRMRAQNNSTGQRLGARAVQRLGDRQRLIDGTDRNDELARGASAGWSPGAAAPQGWGWTDNGWGVPGRQSTSPPTARTSSACSSARTA